MTDLEITKLCAEAMGEEEVRACADDWPWEKYDPLRDDVDAMALVKKYQMDISCVSNSWHAELSVITESKRLLSEFAICADLNRAICECVAKMQQGKSG